MVIVFKNISSKESLYLVYSGYNTWYTGILTILPNKYVSPRNYCDDAIYYHFFLFDVVVLLAANSW